MFQVFDFSVIDSCATVNDYARWNRSYDLCVTLASPSAAASHTRGLWERMGVLHLTIPFSSGWNMIVPYLRKICCFAACAALRLVLLCALCCFAACAAVRLVLLYCLYCWLLLVAVGCYWLLLVAVGCYWLLLVAVGCCWCAAGANCC